MASAASLTQHLVTAALTNGSLKFLWASEIAWYHCSNQTVSFSLSVPEDHGILCMVFRRGWPTVFNRTGLVIKLQGPLGALCSKSECRSSVLGLKTIKSAPLICRTHLST